MTDMALRFRREPEADVDVDERGENGDRVEDDILYSVLVDGAILCLSMTQGCPFCYARPAYGCGSPGCAGRSGS